MDIEKDTSLEDLITVRAVQISSMALVTDDPARLARIATAVSLLAIASNMTDSSNVHRLINVANRVR